MKILTHFNDRDHHIRIIELVEDQSRLYYESGALYTHVDRNGNNLLDYVSAMEVALESPSRFLLLGTAGGALATRLSRLGAAVTAVDICGDAFRFARRWFHLPSAVECVHSDALAFLQSTTRRWDAIAVDVFRGTEIPDSFLTTETSRLLAKALLPGGLVVWNVADTPQSWPAQWIGRTLRQAGFATRCVSVLGHDVGNTLIVGRSGGDKTYNSRLADPMPPDLAA